MRAGAFASVLTAVSLAVTGLAARAEPSPDDPFTMREVDFAGPGVSLAGSLLIPSGEGPFPGVVIVHGSGTSARSNPWTSAWAEALVLRGVAVLYPDKRGAGRSGGNWREADFADLADDALAALDVLRAEPRVDRERVGLIGFSQGGHIAPLAAFPTDPESPAWGFLRTIGNFDPLPCWREIDVPVAFLFGQRDSHVDVAKSVRIVQETLMTDGRSVSLLVFAGSGHAHFRADALDFLARWVRDGGVDQGLTAPGSSSASASPFRPAARGSGPRSESRPHAT